MICRHIIPTAQISAMNAAVLLVSILVWTFMIVGNDSRDCGVSCNNVTGTVGNEVIFNCSISEQKTGCFTVYKFQYPEKYNDSVICGQFSHGCEKMHIFTCRYTPDTAMKETFRFYVHGGRNCAESKDFTVEISDFCSVSCNNVTGTVGNEVTLTCSIPQQCTECCIQLYKFQHPTIYDYSVICRQEFPKDVCEQRTSFTCRYTPDTAMKKTFTFISQTLCRVKRSEFTVEISGPSETRTDTESADIKDHGSKPSIVAGMSCSIIIIIFLIAAFVYVKCFKSTNTAGLQMTERGAEQALMTTNDL
ncbi:uncharacterized protein LOC130238122 [Danio aesculapii]|uniref:uncharacterized protein LOC130238122 n=1 Tax=Danio aesculapii TaxID=1142201 RepID=UPI0024C083D3|nr:uncharacterized protein LOC130238122 [Danio aesculapii]